MSPPGIGRQSAFGGNAAFSAGSQTTSQSAILGLKVTRDFFFNGSSATTPRSFDDVAVTGKTTLNTGSGKDTINIETLTTLLGSTSIFTKDVQIELGASATGTLTIGILGDAQHRATFGAAALFDGGPGASDTYNQGSAVFLGNGAPNLNGFENFG